MSAGAGMSTNAEVVRTHLVIGLQDQVLSALERAHADGRLVGVRDVAHLPDGQVQVTAELRELSRAEWFRRRIRWSARPWLIVAGGVGAGAVCVGLLAWLVALAVQAVVAAITAALAWVQTYGPGLAVIAVVVLALCTAGGAKCAGLHCGGCRR